tara:strand:- start:1276 stop:2154 length:879 start_codon:yes stop_codon:yes gene_type:complete
MEKKYIYIFIIIIILIYLILNLRHNYIKYNENKNIKKELDLIFNKLDQRISSNDNIIPKKVFQTYIDKKKIPDKVSKNFKKYAKGYERVLYDDKDALIFLNDNFGDIFVKKFKSMKSGAHKSDLLRYCYLYINGGIYIDIKTELLVDLDVIIKERKNRLYTVLSCWNFIAYNFTDCLMSVYQGFIAVPPKNFFIKEIIYKYMYTNNFFVNFPFHINYMVFCEQFYGLISDYTKTNFLKVGNYKIKNFSFELFQEVNDCSKGKQKDRYGLCVTVRDKNNRILMNNRYPDYPWK